ncbi:MAG: UDP-N-acetylmuramoyl-tripeptide--D-alanyl-D-alanine ligase [Paludibacteraceae bacterium]|nr:UDP-N-acetylmuramoyl-tripeptide--D-alanyl-D-alanine ligase [Paludibacteraceae bacterium]
MSIEDLYKIYEQHPVVTTDSRNTPDGSIFFALKGESFDGNKFAMSALESGCSYAVVDEAEYAVSDKFILVDDVLRTLQQLAAYHRIAIGLPVVGITGTNGKTTTKELVSAVLSAKYNILYTKGNLNNHIGVPLTVLSITKEHQIAVVEMGASHPGDIKELVDIAAPNVGLITNVGRAHLAGFGSFEGVIKTKCELYDFLRESDSSVFVNLDNDILLEKSDGMNRIGYGLKDRSGLVWGSVMSNSPFLTMKFAVSGDDKEYVLETSLIGSYNAENVLAAVCVGTYFGVAPSQIKSAIESYQPTNSRSQYKKTDRNSLIIDAYNANPTSMAASINNFNEVTLPNKALILGEMRELGADSDAEHQKIIDMLENFGLTDVRLVGHCFDSAKTSFTRYADVDALIADLKANPVEGKTILVKGSNGNHLDKVVEWL